MERASDREIWSDNEKSDGSFDEINNGTIEHTETRIVLKNSQRSFQRNCLLAVAKAHN